MAIVDLGQQPERVRDEAATLLVEHFDEPHGWIDVAAAREEVARVIREGFARGMPGGGVLLGWVGGLPQYDGRVWELHPMVVQRAFRRRGIGRALVAAFEAEAAIRGALTLTLGTDDDSGMTSLAGVDLYSALPRHIEEVHDLGRGHPILLSPARLRRHGRDAGRQRTRAPRHLHVEAGPAVAPSDRGCRSRSGSPVRVSRKGGSGITGAG
jgi:aminoglycoside 6'-N-acetyltransferase I